MSVINKRNPKEVIAFLGFILALILVDQLSKIWAISMLENQPVASYLADIFRFTYAENHGAFLSLGSHLPEFARFLIMVIFNAIVLLAVFIYVWKQWEISTVQRFVYGMILAGGIGNLIDRIFRGGVVIDFLNIGIGTLRSGIFNLADIWISAGVVLLIFLWYLFPEENSSAPKEASSPKMPSSTLNNLLILLTTSCTLLYSASILQADTVVYKAGTKGGRVAITGTILDYNSITMIFRVKSPDKIHEIQQSQILAFEATYLEFHQQAIQLLKDKQYGKANQAVKKALITETRPWVRRELMALAVQADVNLNNWQTATAQYLAMLQSDANTRNRDFIPLHWRKNDLSDADRIFAVRELTSTDLSTQLIAASWLLQTKGWETRASKVLESLLTCSDEQIRHLARCQQWRVQLSTHQLTDRDLVRWEKHLRKLPEGYRAGPTFLIAKGYAMRVQPDLAAARFLWLTIIDSRNHNLTKQATLNAAQQLQSLGQTAAANRLREEDN